MVRDTDAHDRRSFLQIAGSAGAAGMAGLAGCTGGDGGDGDGDGDGGDGDGGDGGGGTTPTPTQTTPSDGGMEPLRIGQLTPLSGPLADSGEDHVRGGQIAADTFNADDGIGGHQIELVNQDSEASPDTAVQRARQLVQQDNVDVIVGVVSSAVAKAVSQFSAQQGVPIVLTAAQTPDVTKQECQRTTFRTTTNIIHQQRTTAVTINEYTPDDATRVAGVNPDYVYGHQSWDIFKQSFQNRRSGVEYVGEQFPAFLKGDYKKEIQATLDTDPDIVHSVLYSADLIAFIKQAHQFDFFDEVDYFYADVTPTVVSVPLGDQFPTGALCIADSYFRWPESYQSTPDRVTNFVTEYRDRYDAMPGVFAYEQHAALSALKGAIEESGGKSTDDIINGLEGLSFSSVVPDMTIRAEDHQAIHDVYFGGVMGPIDEYDFKGFTEFSGVPAAEFRDEPECSF